MLKLVELFWLTDDARNLLEPIQLGVQKQEILLKIFHVNPLFLLQFLYIDMIKRYGIKQIIKREEIESIANAHEDVHFGHFVFSSERVHFVFQGFEIDDLIRDGHGHANIVRGLAVMEFIAALLPASGLLFEEVVTSTNLNLDLRQVSNISALILSIIIALVNLELGHEWVTVIRGLFYKGALDAASHCFGCLNKVLLWLISIESLELDVANCLPVLYAKSLNLSD